MRNDGTGGRIHLGARGLDWRGVANCRLIFMFFENIFCTGLAGLIFCRILVRETGRQTSEFNETGVRNVRNCEAKVVGGVPDDKNNG